jgi:hypothetical protein
LGSTQAQLAHDEKLDYVWVLSKVEPELYILHRSTCVSIRYRKAGDERYIPVPNIEYVKNLAVKDRKPVLYCALCNDESKVKAKMYRG